MKNAAINDSRENLGKALELRAQRPVRYTSTFVLRPVGAPWGQTAAPACGHPEELVDNPVVLVPGDPQDFKR
jgi:hypothetical protein